VTAPASRTVFKWLLISIVILPIFLGSWVAKSFPRRQGFSLLVGLYFLYSLAYVVMLHYLHHRWGAS
jgi:hypothetical protein